MNISLTKNSTHLMFDDTKFDDLGIQTGRKVGFLQIKEDRDPDEVLAKAKELEWKFGNVADPNGLYPVERVVESK